MHVLDNIFIFILWNGGKITMIKLSLVITVDPSHACCVQWFNSLQNLTVVSLCTDESRYRALLADMKGAADSVFAAKLLSEIYPPLPSAPHLPFPHPITPLPGLPFSTVENGAYLRHFWFSFSELKGLSEWKNIMFLKLRIRISSMVLQTIKCRYANKKFIKKFRG